MTQAIATIALVVRDYDEAIAFYRDVLGFDLVADTPLGDKRWVVVAPAGGGARLLLAKADGEAQAARGLRVGGRVRGPVWEQVGPDPAALSAGIHRL